MSPQAFLTLFSFNTINQLVSALLSNFSFGLNYANNAVSLTQSNLTINSNTVNFESNDVSSTTDSLYSQLGSSSDFRNNPFTNPIISYDYKCGHYLGL
jgi:nitrous oxidase accessory protein NosD